ncbi:[alpha-L-fucopyranosyl-(1-_3)-alpha-L-rhamnopyran osyl-(1-_3)-2-O-methyl-alpha-L-rhamnopyranosyl] dimycocerosyl phenol-phthiocerol 2'''-O-methyltransferase [Rhabdobacter roseus]|uniref:FkbM family methyltransferase n=1 Tax=Rhabdobacter roseus TaxID=1655419 RepID=A0A840TSJ9_9BACT|nr:FkbM family methyltransferase [Rhabdobacter roseus]MBB5284243.1 FkbM family methyltransferase [Rhabdobacter roseus]
MNFNSIIRLFNLTKILFNPTGGIFYLSNSLASVSSFLITHKLFALSSSFSTIVDVGANKGQFAFAATRFFPNARVFSFEPVPETFTRLEKNIRKIPQIQAFQYGLGSTNGEINFYQNAHSHASSALPVSDFQKNEIPITAETTLIKVPIKRLDDVVQEWNMSLDGPILLKLDVQGYEKEVLKGASEFIKRVDYLLFEASFVSMYEGEPLFEEMHDFVRGLGFRLVGPVGSLQTDKEQIVQMDMLYKKELIS